MPFQPSRPRRNRRNAAIRGLARESRLHPEQLIYPLFCVDGAGIEDPIGSLPGMARLSEDKLLAEIERSWNLGIRNFCLFPAVEEHLKDKTASHSWADDNFYLRIARNIKARFPECSLMSDVAMDPYSSDGHDGVVTDDGRIDNEATLPILARMSVAQAQAGFDWIGPSDMMDGRIGVIREALDENGYHETGILAYTAKYASAFYGPFRDALDSAPKSGDKKTYQMDPANVAEALRELELDEMEGADVVMVKPALAYLDVIRAVKEHTRIASGGLQCERRVCPRQGRCSGGVPRCRGWHAGGLRGHSTRWCRHHPHLFRARVRGVVQAAAWLRRCHQLCWTKCGSGWKHSWQKEATARRQSVFRCSKRSISKAAISM